MSEVNEKSLIQKIILNQIFVRTKVSRKTRVLILEGFPPQWADALVSTLSEVFLNPSIIQTNLSVVGSHALARVSEQDGNSSKVVLVDNLNGIDSNDSAVLFKNMLYSYPHFHYVVMSYQSSGGWNLPNQFGSLQVISLQEEITREIETLSWIPEAQKQDVMVSASPSDFELVRFTEKIFPKYQLEDLVLSHTNQYHFLEILNAAQQKLNGRYQSIWKAKHSRGHGVILLFYGKSGTGKTMAAEVIARSLGYPLYRVNYSQVQSKYIGETEKNLEAIFKAAQGVQGVLLFDEGESLFAHRTATSTSNDRYANQEVSYLLQAIEKYEGVVIVNTNYDQELDSAFLRRFTRTMRFTAGGSLEVQEKLWRSILPSEIQLEGDIDFKLLAIQPLTGGDIRNVLMNAFLVSEKRGQVSDEPPSVTMIDLLWFARIECHKKGVEFRENSLPIELKEIVGTECEKKVLEVSGDPLHIKHIWNSQTETLSPTSLILPHREERLRAERAMIAHQKRLQSRQLEAAAVSEDSEYHEKKWG